VKELTKKQIFDLQFKYGYTSGSPAVTATISEKEDDWWNNGYFWNWISRMYYLSEDFIRNYKDFVNWGSISRYQKLSEEFIFEFKEYLIYAHLIDNRHIPSNLKHRIINESGEFSHEEK